VSPSPEPGERETDEAAPPASRHPAPSGWRHRDLTQGSLVSSLLVLALPLIASGVLGGAVFQIFDLTFVSRLGEEAIAAVVITNQTVRQVSLMIVMGASFATQSLISRAIGNDDLERAEHVAGQSISLGIGLGILVALVGGLFPETLFSLAGPNESFYATGVPYLRLVFLLHFGVIGTLLFGAILGGAGDTTTPLLVQVVQFSVAIAAEWVLIFGNLGAPAFGVQGAALGIACGQLVAMGLGVAVLFRGHSRVHLRRRHLVPDLPVMGEILRIAGPSALQMIGGVAMTFAFIRLAGTFGEQVQTAYAIGLRLGMIVPMVCFPIATACATLVGQAIGAGDVPRAWRAIGVGIAVHAGIMWSFAAGMFWFRVQILGFFSDDPEVIRIGSEYLVYSSAAFIFLALYFVFFRSLQGAGEFLVPMAITLTNSLLVAIPLGIFLVRATSLGPSGIWIAQLVSAIVATTATGIWLASGRWTRRAAHS
jgi:putative MATE family efflux protein